MTDRDQSAELQQLRDLLAALTRRVYRLEELLGARAQIASAPPPHPSQPKPETVSAPSLPRSASAAEPPASTPSAMPALLPARIKTAKPTASLESRIGGQWLNRVGIIAVLVGLSYFLKLAFENNWIGPTTQVLIGILAGIALLFWSERFRAKGYPGFAYSLKAVAVGALYLSLWAASQYYHLVPPTVTFLGMVMVTMTSAALSLRQNSELLAAYALVGGFLTPVLVSTGQNHEIALFCYLALLDLGTFWIVALKRWQQLLLGSFIGTELLFGAWASSYYSDSQLGATLAFVTLFFLLYAGAPFLGRKSSPSRILPGVMIALALFNGACFFAACYLMLYEHHREFLAWLTIALAGFFFGLKRVLQKQPNTAADLQAYLHLVLSVGFLTIAIPLKLDGHWITFGWLVEAGGLFWVSHRGKSLLLRILGAAVFALGVGRLLAVDNFDGGALFFNPRFGLYLTAIAAIALLAWISLQQRDETNRQWAGAAIIGANILALLALHFEIVHYFQPQFRDAYSETARQNVATLLAFTYSAVWMIYGSALMLVGFWKRSAFLRWQAIILLALTAAKVFIFDIATLQRGYRIAAFIVLGVILLAVSFFYQRGHRKAAE